MEEQEKKKKREWWEIPARCAVLFIIIPIFIPMEWYRAAYLYTIGRFFPYTIESRTLDIEKDVQKRLKLQEMPTELRIVVLKREKQVELWGKNPDGKWKKLNFYAIMNIAEAPGPKTHKDDAKSPEGIYSIRSMDPNSIYYLSLTIDYPSQEDIELARKEGRDTATLGDGYLIHGLAFSRNNLILSDQALEELFYMLAKVGLQNAKVLIVPNDYRKEELPEYIEAPWIMERYKLLKKELEPLKTDEDMKKNAETGKN